MRKSILLFFSTLFIILSVKAQINKGSILLGGSFGFSTAHTLTPNTPENKLTQFTISPSVGLAVKDNSVVGILFSYAHSSDNNNTQDNKFFGGGVYWRKYFPLGKSFYFFTNAQLSYNYSEYSYTQPDNAQTSKESSVYITIYPGVTYAINKRFHLEASLNNLASVGYTHTENVITNLSGQTTSKQNSVSLQTNISSANPFNFGFRFLLAK